MIPSDREPDQMYVCVPRIAIGTLARAPVTLAVYLKLLSRARWRPGQRLGHHGVIDLDSGQCVMGRDEIAAECGTSATKVRTAIRHLSQLGYITSESSTAGTVVTIVGYADLGPRG